jgi:hypothetical protein
LAGYGLQLAVDRYPSQAVNTMDPSVLPLRLCVRIFYFFGFPVGGLR